jgi:lysophospholipase L1-like esterase
MLKSLFINGLVLRHFKAMLSSCLLVVALSALSLLAGCTDTTDQQQWVGTWVTAQQLVEPHNNPPEPGLSNNTLRQVLRVSIGGDSLRVRFSNEYSQSAVTLKQVQIALSLGQSTIDESSAKTLLFDNKPEVIMQPGTAVTSDALAFALLPRADVSITIFFGETSADVTGHPGSRTTSYLIEGDQINKAELTDAVKTDHWYVISGIDVKAPAEAGAVAILGNSITDGRGSGTNKQNRWPDILSESLLANPATQMVGVLNQGIGGNCVLKQCLGPSALNRFESDVLNQHGVRWLIVLEGVNDLGQTRDSTHAMKVADDLIAAYESMIVQAHQHQIKVYGATILPFGKSFYYTDFREPARQKVNNWVRNSQQFDAVIDFDKLMRDPNDTIVLLPNVHTGDFLHPNEAGYQLMGQSIDLSLFE